MSKMVKCKTCGAEISKASKSCPNCGAKQPRKVIIISIIIIVIAVIGGIGATIGENNNNISSSQPQNVSFPGSQTKHSESGDTPTNNTIIFEGQSTKVTYLEAFESKDVSGCFYLKLKIENIGNIESVYSLTDCYVDDSACKTGSGLPIVAAPGKNTSDSFIIFCEKPLSDISKVEFQLEARDKNDYSVLENSGTITISLK